MFLPEDLLFKSGQLARVWLAANQHKKLTKAQVLQDKIDEDIQVIMRPEGAAGGPLALRLNGQLLLGVVRIYHRKAHYLHDDCNDALWKIKMAFRPGNIDLPSHTHVANPESLMVQDMITDLDLLAPMPDPELLLSQALGTNLDLPRAKLPDWGGSSQFLSGSIEQQDINQLNFEEEDLEDLGLDIGEGADPRSIFDDGTSIERGRDAPLDRVEEFDNMVEIVDDDLGIDIGEDSTEVAHAPEMNLGDFDIEMGGTELELNAGSIAGDLPVRSSRAHEPALSETGDDDASRLAEDVTDQNTTTFDPNQEPEEEESVMEVRAPKRPRRAIPQDSETMISTAQLKDQQNNRDKILKPASFLPRDPLLMALINMQKSGGFVSSILDDGRSQGWAPELRGILSLEVVSRSSQKRKRDSGVADLGTTEDEAVADSERTPQLEFDHDETSLGGAGYGLGGGSTTLGGSDDMIQLPDDPVIQQNDDDEDVFSPLVDTFDETNIPLVYPEEAGPVSLGTKHAVHLLREQFGPEAEEDESVRQKNSIVFQDLLPETRTSRADATKMFFEVLILATKDAIKVEQPTTELGGPLRIRAKRGLWGQWAETAAAGELASQTQTTPPAGDIQGPAESMMQAHRVVSVSA